MTRRRHSGQASVEAIALVPLLVMAVLLAWQLAVLVGGALIAQDRARELALPSGGVPGPVRDHVDVPVLLPGVGSLRIPIRAEVRAP